MAEPEMMGTYLHVFLNLPLVKYSMFQPKCFVVKKSYHSDCQYSTYKYQQKGQHMLEWVRPEIVAL